MNPDLVRVAIEASEASVPFPVVMGPGWLMCKHPIFVGDYSFAHATEHGHTCISFFSNERTGDTLELTVSVLSMKVIDWRYVPA